VDRRCIIPGDSTEDADRLVITELVNRLVRQLGSDRTVVILSEAVSHTDDGQDDTRLIDIHQDACRRDGSAPVLWHEWQDPEMWEESDS
jgi:hypothetical protein